MPVQLLIAFIAGCAMPLAFAPFSWWPVAILSPAILILQNHYRETARQSFWLGWVFGLGYFGFGVYWVYHSLHVFGHAPVFVAASLTGLLIVYMSLFIGGSLAIYNRLQRCYPKSWVVWSLPLIWFAMEWSKGWVLTGFPWLSVGYAHINSPLSGFAPVIGVYGLSALSILISLILVLWKQQSKHVLVVPIVLIGLAGYELQQIEWTDQSGESLKVTMIQGNIPQDMKWKPDQRPKIMQLYWQTTQDYWSSDLIVWPEVAIPGRSEDLQENFLTPVSEAARENNSNLMTGIVVSDWKKREYYNSMLLLGQHQGVYHKRHMVPFGEYMPFRSVLEFMKNYIKIPMSDMTPGPQQQTLMSINDIKLGVSICYEDVFSRDINLDLPAANILVNTSNDAWFGDSLAPHQHLEIAQMRSLETGRAMVRSTNTGRSAFIDHRGRLMQAGDQFILQTLTADIEARSGATPFITFALLQPYISLIILLLCGYFLYQSRRLSR